MKSSKSLKPPLLLTISCIPYCFFYRCRDYILYLLDEDLESNCGDSITEFQAYNHPKNTL